MLLGEDVKIRTGEKRIYYGGGTSPIYGASVDIRGGSYESTTKVHIRSFLGRVGSGLVPGNGWVEHLVRACATS